MVHRYSFMVGAIDKSHYIPSLLSFFRAHSLSLSFEPNSIAYELITHMAKESLRPNDRRE